MLETKLETQENMQQARMLVRGIMKSRTNDINQLNYDMGRLQKQFEGTPYQEQFGTIYQMYQQGDVIRTKKELDGQLAYFHRNYLSN